MTKLEAVMAEQRHWQEIVGLRTVAELNAAVRAGEATNIINVSEALQERKIAVVADQIQETRCRIVLLAGPSSSGKTTTSKRLAIQLSATGLRPLNISMDNYFVNREDTPRDDKGDYDYECLEALDVRLFNEQLQMLLDGGTVELPRYNFQKGMRENSGTRLKLNQNEVLIVEGIHALNPQLTSQIPRDWKYQLYVSALTTIQLDEQRRISTSDNRLLRRIIRDHKFRGYSATETIRRWPSVRAGEEKWIFPFQENADIMFNSALLYELAVLRPHVEPLLRAVPEGSPEHDEAMRLLRVTDFFEPIPDKQIPFTSLLREFLGGSAFHY